MKRKHLNIGKLLTILLLLGTGMSSKAQSADEFLEMGERFHVDLETDSTLISTYVLKQSKDFKLRPKSNYTWYDKDTIRTTLGSADGGLLHGRYQEMSIENKQTLVEGQYKRGRRVGVWIYRDSNGSILRKEEWSAGKQENTSTYDSTGELIEKIKLKKKQKPKKKPKVEADDDMSGI